MLRSSPPFISNTNQVNHLMVKVIATLLPALLMWLYLYGLWSIVQFILCVITCYVAEWLLLTLRKKPLLPFLSDGSAMVTALLLAFCLPPLSPWWLAVCSCLFAMLLGKHLYGGIGQNIFNPAMLGYAVALISFPAEFAVWQSSVFSTPEVIDFVRAIKYIFIAQDDVVNSSATMLAQWRQQSIPIDINWLQQPSFYLNMTFLCGGILLLLLRVISWHIPLGLLAGVVMTTSILVGTSDQWIDGVSFHLFAGATMIGAFFIATDPVSAASSKRANFCYAVLIGVLTVLIRIWGNFPDGIAFAILIANLFVPLLDYFIKR